LTSNWHKNAATKSIDDLRTAVGKLRHPYLRDEMLQRIQKFAEASDELIASVEAENGEQLSKRVSFILTK